MPRVEIPITLSFTSQTETLSCFATVKNQNCFSVLGDGVGSGGSELGRESKGRNKRKNKRKECELNCQMCFHEIVVFCGPIAIFRLHSCIRFLKVKVEAAVYN